MNETVIQFDAEAPVCPVCLSWPMGKVHDGVCDECRDTAEHMEWWMETEMDKEDRRRQHLENLTVWLNEERDI